jgi:PAS domain S-box-containing protein
MQHKKLSRNLGYDELSYKYELLTQLMNRIPDVIYFKDKKGKLVLVNNAHAKGLGLKPEEVIGKTDFDIFPRERAALMAKDDDYVIKTGKPILDKIERATRPDGVDNYVSTTKVPRYDEKGRVVGIIGITRDVTKRMQFEKLKEEKNRIEKKLKNLEDLNRMKSEFISVVSHEIRTPLTIIKEAIMLMLDEVVGSVNEKQRELLGRATQNIERLKRIIDELLDLSKIESSQFKLRYSLVNLNDLIEDSAGFFKKLAQEKQVTLEYILPKKQANIFLDFGRFNQIISNLINNAIKFTEEDGRIKVELKILESKVRVGVIDTGIGISKQDLPRLFNRFVQVSNKVEVKRMGVGLGLSIVKELVEKHGGEVWAESKLGLGSKFYFTLPRFYTTSVLEKSVRDKINYLLDSSISAYLINVLIVNYNLFKKRIKTDPKWLFNDFVSIINDILQKNTLPRIERPEIVFKDIEYGECGIIYPNAAEEEAAELCRLFKEKILEYITRKKLQNVFINIGSLPYSVEGQLKTSHQLLANLSIKKLYIGSEIRRFRRINYKADAEILISKDKVENTQTIDLSVGGLCFTSSRLLKTDSCIEIKLKIAGHKGAICLKGRVAWLKEAEQFFDNNRYKIGLEFVNMKAKEKNIISQFIRRISK